MASLTLDNALVSLVAFLLPLRLLSLGSRLLLLRGRWSGRGLSGSARSMILLASSVVLITAILGISDTSPSGGGALISEMEDLRFKTSRLESLLEESMETLNSKELHLEEKYKLIGEMEEKIQFLQNALHEIKGSVSDLLKAEDWIRALEEEVQLLLEQSMKNENNIQTLESSVDDAREKMEVTGYEIEKMDSIVTEQWIQIRQLEQAFQLTKMMTSKVLRRSLQKDMNRSRMPRKFATSKVVQFIRSICRFHLPEVNLPDSFFLRASFSKSSISQAYNQLKLLMSVAQEFHYELQGFIKHEMQMHELTAGLANNLVVFILASTLMIAPIIFAWNVSSSYLGLLKR
ncbi:hypothetical protein OPV22_032735 [Ensete ventricosum]|uniref:SUN domain-containing protein n=1 Tax=Ensete ventricosum TaxID=4639 RepID=A0AAV8Q019_ENSVE|nr:hypothetical protein OPV22_032735 [Ensete ventricosum]